MRATIFTSFALLGCATPLPPTEPVAQGCMQVGLEEGACAPDFQLLNADGTPIRLADKVGDRLVVVGSSLW